MQDFKQLAIKRLRKTSLFKELSKKEIEILINDSRTIFESFDKSEKIYDPINYKKSLAYVLKGNGIVLSPIGKNKGYLMKDIKEGDFVGVASLFNSKEKYVSEIKALKDMIIVFFKEELIQELIETNKKFALSYVEFLSDRINYLNSKINMLVGDSNRSKLIEYLINQCSEENNKLKISMSKLSKTLNMGRSSLYREMDELEDIGIIKKLGNKEYLIDYNSLFEYRI